MYPRISIFLTMVGTDVWGCSRSLIIITHTIFQTSDLARTDLPWERQRVSKPLPGLWFSGHLVLLTLSEQWDSETQEIHICQAHHSFQILKHYSNKWIEKKAIECSIKKKSLTIIPSLNLEGNKVVCKLENLYSRNFDL